MAKRTLDQIAITPAHVLEVAVCKTARDRLYVQVIYRRNGKQHSQIPVPPDEAQFNQLLDHLKEARAIALAGANQRAPEAVAALRVH